MTNKAKTVEDILKDNFEGKYDDGSSNENDITNVVSQLKELVVSEEEIDKTIEEWDEPYCKFYNYPTTMTEESFRRTLAKSIHKLIIERLFGKEEK